MKNNDIVDPNIERRNQFTSTHCRLVENSGEKAPLFSVFEINSSGLCNRTCSFCPRGNPGFFPNEKKYLSLELFENVLKTLAPLSYDGLFLISAFSEPLLHKDLEKILELSKRYCPLSRAELVTNGDPLSVKRMKSLFAAGLDTILISMYDGPEQIDHFKGVAKAAEIPEEKMVLRRRFSLDDFQLTNRTGTVQDEFSGQDVVFPMKKSCYLPSYTVFMDYDGEVYLCTHDWGRRFSAGNVKNSSIVDIWVSEKLKEARRRLLNDDRDFNPCHKCNVEGTLVGEEHGEAWKKYFQEKAKIEAN